MFQNDVHTLLDIRPEFLIVYLLDVFFKFRVGGEEAVKMTS